MAIKANLMNKRYFLHAWLLIVSFLMTGCVTPRNPDGTIDACKLTKPPKEAHVAEAGHNWRWFSYPNPYEIPSNYTGCVKGWLGDYSSNPKHFLVLSIRFDSGLVSNVESYDSGGIIASCMFDKNETIIKESLTDKTPKDCHALLAKARNYVKR